MEQTIDFAGKKYQGIIYSLGNVPLIIVKAKKGYVACSYIEKGSAEKLGDVAAFVSGVKCFEDVFRAKIKTATMAFFRVVKTIGSLTAVTASLFKKFAVPEIKAVVKAK